MPKSTGVPSYRYHKARDCAVVTLDGKNYYLGPFDSPESKATYAEKIAEWQRHRSAAPPPSTVTVYTVGRLTADYFRFAQTWYVKNGEPTKQVGRIREAVKPLAALYEHLSVDEFGPLKLRNVQQHFVGCGYSRNYINSLVGCIKLAFKWGAGEERVPASVPEALKYVPNLQRGRTAARESKPVLPVDEATVNATLKYLSPVVASMVKDDKRTELLGSSTSDVTESKDWQSLSVGIRDEKQDGATHITATAVCHGDTEAFFDQLVLTAK